jgi:hypothetical protein
MPFLSLSMHHRYMNRIFFWRSNFIGDVGPTTYVAPNEPVGILTNGTKVQGIRGVYPIYSLQSHQMIRL